MDPYIPLRLFRDKCGNLDQNLTGNIKSYWEPEYGDAPEASIRPMSKKTDWLHVNLKMLKHDARHG